MFKREHSEIASPVRKGRGGLAHSGVEQRRLCVAFFLELRVSGMEGAYQHHNRPESRF